MTTGSSVARAQGTAVATMVLCNLMWSIAGVVTRQDVLGHLAGLAPAVAR